MGGGPLLMFDLSLGSYLDVRTFTQFYSDGAFTIVGSVLGAGPGGSSVFYDRYFPIDRALFPNTLQRKFPASTGHV